MVRERNLRVALPQPSTGLRPSGRCRADTHRARPSPTRCAQASLRSTSAKTVIAPISAAIPVNPAIRRPVLGLPCRAISASASTGRLSLAKLFQIPVSSSETLIRERENPQE